MDPATIGVYIFWGLVTLFVVSFLFCFLVSPLQRDDEKKEE
jgi:predicted PurR-regulated permease PerM